jgi:transitional endoplasmic reticulum ATPase
VESPKVEWRDIAGLECAKSQIRRYVEGPLSNPDGFRRLGIRRAPKGVLLFGPPGTGKTLIAQAIATSTGQNFIHVRASDLLSAYHSESEQNVADLFRRAREAKPVILFIDEFDALAPDLENGPSSETEHKTGVVKQLLGELDGIKPLRGVTIIAATNRPDKIHAAMLRPGRFDKLVYIGLPDLAGRAQAFRVHTEGMALGSDVDCEELARSTPGFSCADIANVALTSGLDALDEDENASLIEMRHFRNALAQSAPSVDEKTAKEYLALERRFCRNNERATQSQPSKVVPLHAVRALER